MGSLKHVSERGGGGGLLTLLSQYCTWGFPSSVISQKAREFRHRVSLQVFPIVEITILGSRLIVLFDALVLFWLSLKWEGSGCQD